MTGEVDPRHQKLMQAAERFRLFAEEFHAESDRGCAVLVLCVLEDALRDLFKAFIADAESEKLSNLAPPGRLKVGVENAAVLGLVSEQQARAFMSLVKVRNRFAHGVLNGLTFDSEDVANAVRSIEPIVPLAPEHISEIKSRPVRRQFLIHAGFVWILLAMRAAFIERLAPAPDPDPSQLPPGFPGVGK